jgi:hypothetical protein
VAQSRPDLTTDLLLADAPIHEGYKVLGGVVLYEKLGQGGMGMVYRGRHLRLNIDVAVKVMASPASPTPDAADNFVRRFIREAQTAASVRHQNLARVIDVNTEGGIYYLVMDYIDGESAADRLRRKGSLSEQEAVEIALGAAEGLAEAHRRGIVHRDVKPDNILIGKDGTVVVADLGLAKAFEAGEAEGSRSMGLSMSQQAMGTPFYMSPEQSRSAKDVGPQADVWSLGVTLYELLTGKVPWHETDLAELIMKIRNDGTPSARECRAELSDGVCTIIQKALEKDASRRYQDCGEIAKALKSHLDSMAKTPGSVLPDAEAGTTKLALVSVTPPAAETITLIAAAALGETPRGPASARDGAEAKLRDTSLADVVEKRLWVEALRRQLGESESGLPADVLRSIDLDLQVAKEIEDRDRAAAFERLARAERKLGELREGMERRLQAEHERFPKEPPTEREQTIGEREQEYEQLVRARKRWDERAATPREARLHNLGDEGQRASGVEAGVRHISNESRLLLGAMIGAFFVSLVSSMLILLLAT